MGPESHREKKDTISGVIQVPCPNCGTRKGVSVYKMPIESISLINTATCSNKKCGITFFFYVIARTTSATIKTFKNSAAAYLSYESAKKSL